MLAGQIRGRADELAKRGQSLRFELLGFEGDASTAADDVAKALALFHADSNPHWLDDPALEQLDQRRRTRLINDVNELTFLWVLALHAAENRTDHPRPKAAAICELAMVWAKPIAPWQALLEHCLAPTESEAEVRFHDDPTTVKSPQACFEWGVLRNRQGRPAQAAAWLERATRLEPRDYWSHSYLAFIEAKLGDAQNALVDYGVAIAINPSSPWARINRAKLYRGKREWNQALEDLNQALESAEGADRLDAMLELGIVEKFLGNSATRERLLTTSWLQTRHQMDL